MDNVHFKKFFDTRLTNFPPCGHIHTGFAGLQSLRELYLLCFRDKQPPLNNMMANGYHHIRTVDCCSRTLLQMALAQRQYRQYLMSSDPPSWIFESPTMTKIIMLITQSSRVINLQFIYKTTLEQFIINFIGRRQ